MTEEVWSPACSLDSLKARAEMYAQIRSFFSQKGLLEVETPILGSSTATDPFLDSMSLVSQGKSHFLHTSPEFPMKRLLAAYQRAIFQICKTFRNGESGSRHNPEFTMLEWYQPGYDLQDLLSETLDLVKLVCGPFEVEVLTYRQAFLHHVGIDPFKVEPKMLSEKVRTLSSYSGEDLDRLGQLDLLLSECIEPKLGYSGLESPNSDQSSHSSSNHSPTNHSTSAEGQSCSDNFRSERKISVLTEYPAEQASLARIKLDEFGNAVAERFELYIEGLEIANAYHELTDAKEQRIRFEVDNTERAKLGLLEIPLDEYLLTAMERGLPKCSGIALGLDRLLMIKTGASHIDDVLAFPISRS